ncbi:MAG: ABC transporter substrate-binding protein, partial [Dehalococcoidia bacterium]|nr:ABC transporter substrate-binding protein [Dehalococcoidia bacterium]
MGSMDPAVTNLPTFNALSAPVFDSLVDLDPEGQVRPGIAERWEIAKDGMTHTFYIRKGVKFHDGSDLTGEDVKFSLERMMAPKVINVDGVAWRGLIASVDLKDDYTVVLQLKKPQFDLLKGIVNASGGGAVLPKRFIEEKGEDRYWQNPVGSGPWKVVKWEPGTRLELEANENHWRAAPKFKNLTVLNITEESTKVAMLKTGEMDLAEIGPDSVAGIKAAGLRVVGHYGGSQLYGFIFYDMDNPQNYAFGDVRVRKAVSLAVDRKEMADKIYRGQAQPDALWYVPRTAYFFDPSLLKPDPYDPDGAKKLLAEAGYANGFSTKIWDMGSDSNSVQAIVGYLRKVGILAETPAIDFATARSYYSPKHDPKILNSIFIRSSSGGIFGFEGMEVGYHSTRSVTKNIRNPRLDELIEKVPQTADPVEKKKLATEAAVLAKGEANILTFVSLDTIFALSSKIGDIQLTKGNVVFGPSLSTITHAK